MMQSSLTMQGKVAAYAATALIAFFALMGISSAQTNKSVNISVSGNATSNQTIVARSRNTFNGVQVGGSGQNNQQLSNSAVALTRVRASSFNGVFNIINISQ